ncbi:MAG: DUF1549 and DUF1553 domain-containing protein [Gemmataceae bacterium]
MPMPPLTRRAVALTVWAAFATSAVAGDVPADWAFKPVTKPTPPAVKRTNWVCTPVDAFVLAKLEAVNRTPSKESDKRTWLRRVTFDLTGLPPTPADIAAFLGDNTPTAHEKVVDRLLASPQFGERAALFWLDVVRYAESDGYKSDDLRPHAWRYRDYVIASFNADKPYTRFLQEQIAGDELFPDDPQAVIATGFLRHYPYEYNAVNVDQKRQDILNDITDTVGAAVLGLTLGCAKCHDHKTDPIAQSDYYRLQAFFAGYWPTEAPVGSPAERADYQRRKAAWDAETADIRRQLAELEQPLMAKAEAKERLRFDADQLRLVDTPEDQLSPLQRQLRQMIARQVHSARKFDPKQMKGADKERWEGMQKRMAEFARDKPADQPTAMVMREVGPVAPPTHLLKRGDHRKPGDEVTPGYLSAIDDQDAEVTPRPNTTGRRAALAAWLTKPDHPLTARVAVNRVWQQLFGTGLVATPADFGATGERPTHPELIDWLATDFTASGWSLKRVYRQIALSATYRQTSGPAGTDDARLLAYVPRKRLDGEALRDAVLAVSGRLNPTAGGPSVYPELPPELEKSGWKPSANQADRDRRSVYVAVKRNLRYPLFALFDSPDRTEVCARRFVTTTAPQALTLLNDKLVLGFARSFAERAAKEAGDGSPYRVAFELATGRPPTEDERAALDRFVSRHPGTSAEALTDLCHALLNTNEFLYVD